MLVDGLLYSMQFEECVETSETVVAPLSRTDYCCWKLYKANGESIKVCVTVLETKHTQGRGYDMKSIAQVLGYYCCNRKASNVPGVCILLNEYDELPFSFSLISKMVFMELNRWFFHRSKPKIHSSWMKKLLH